MNDLFARQDIVIPETETAIAAHAFDGRTDLRAVVIPEHVRTIGSFAFYRARNLAVLSLTDSTDDYHDGAIRSCDALRLIHYRAPHGNFTCMKDMLGDTDAGLLFYLTDLPEEGKIPNAALLYFPPYATVATENTMARLIQFDISGSGTYYRECVLRRSVDYRAYDSYFEKAKIDDVETAARVALGRLLFPYELTASAADRYTAYCKANAGVIGTWLVQMAGEEQSLPLSVEAALPAEGDLEGSGLSAMRNAAAGIHREPPAIAALRYLAARRILKGEALSAALTACAKTGQTELSALLMDYGRPKESTGAAFPTFDL